jgi:hypothetical protein
MKKESMHRKRRENEGEKSNGERRQGRKTRNGVNGKKGIRNHFYCVQFLLNHTEIINQIAVETFRSDPSEKLKRPMST